MTNKQFADILLSGGEVVNEMNSVHSVVGVIDSFYSPTELLTFKEEFDKIVSRKLYQSFTANKVSWERATYINQYLKGDMFTDDISAERNKPCQVRNSQDIIDSTARVLNIK